MARATSTTSVSHLGFGCEILASTKSPICDEHNHEHKRSTIAVMNSSIVHRLSSIITQSTQLESGGGEA